MNKGPIESIRSLVHAGEFEAAGERMLELAVGRGSELNISVGVWIASVNYLKKSILLGDSTSAEIQAERNKLARRALLLLDEMERTSVAPPPGYISRVSIPAARLEKAIGVAPMRSLAWLRRALQAARSVCRLKVSRWHGTGFLVRGGWIVTNHHVIPSREAAEDAVADFNLEEDLDGRISDVTRYRCDPDTWESDATFDCARVRLVPESSLPTIGSWGELELERSAPSALSDDVAIIQHPRGEPKKIAMAANQIVNIYEHRIQYVTDTMPGSSGSPVFNDHWRVVAVHHAGGNLESNQGGDLIYANEGIAIQSIIARLGL